MRRFCTTMMPSVGVSSPPIKLRSVVLPDPDGPISATKSPSGMSRSMPCNASIRSRPRRYTLVRPRICTRGVIERISPALRAVGGGHRLAVLERRRRREDDALAVTDAAQDVAVARRLRPERHAPTLDLAAVDDEDHRPAAVGL